MTQATPPARSRLGMLVLGLPLVCLLTCPVLARPAIIADHYSPDCGVSIERMDDQLAIKWPVQDNEFGRLVLDLRDDTPLIATLGTSRTPDAEIRAVLRGVDPAFFLTVGSRNTPPGKPPEQKWQVFFDKPAGRPHASFASQLARNNVRVSSAGRRATVSLDELTIDSFAGSLDLTFYAGSPLILAEAVVQTHEDLRAIIYDAGLLGDDAAGWTSITWTDTEGRTRQADAAASRKAAPIALRNRAIVASNANGAIACFPPPHQFFYPRDWTNNFGFAWFGAGHRGLDPRFGFGIKQEESGGGAFVPWFNAPPDVPHRLGVFFLLDSGSAEQALQETLHYTNHDRFPELPGRLTMTSHWHMAIAVTAMEQRRGGREPTQPDYVKMFKDLGVNIVHLAEFHGDGHQQDAGPLRLPELESMFDECRRWSDDRLLLIPGEEINTYLGLELPGKHPGHWMSLFPQPVYWTLQPDDARPFVEEHPKYGKVYHVGDRATMIRLLKEQHGLAWAAHPRIKASSWTPDIFREEDFYLAEYWLGGAWKAMPADLFDDRLGRRVLDLLDDMANWGQKKYVLGEVDVFKLDHTHELYGHMNVNYVKLDRLPRFDEGWQPLLDAMSDGQFFVTTGEILIPEFTVGGQESGETLTLPADGRPELRLDLQWTFPLKFVEVISGDGEQVYRQRIDLPDTESFGKQTLTLQPDLSGRRWVRVEAWDIATNGAFTQPVWLSN